MSLDYIPDPAAGESTLEVMADVHQRFEDVDSGEVEVLDSTQEGNQSLSFCFWWGHVTSGLYG